MSILLNTTHSGIFDLYKIDNEYSMFEMNVFGLAHLTVSVMYNECVGNVHAKDYVIICPLAD